MLDCELFCKVANTLGPRAVEFVACRFCFADVKLRYQRAGDNPMRMFCALAIFGITLSASAGETHQVTIDFDSGRFVPAGVAITESRYEEDEFFIYNSCAGDTFDCVLTPKFVEDDSPYFTGQNALTSRPFNLGDLRIGGYIILPSRKYTSEVLSYLRLVSIDYALESDPVDGEHISVAIGTARDIGFGIPLIQFPINPTREFQTFVFPPDTPWEFWFSYEVLPFRDGPVVQLDNLVIEIPEPGSGMLSMLAVVGVGLCSRRR